jgi:hypothetical protein
MAALAQRVELPVEREDQAHVFGDAEIVAGDRYPLVRKSGDLVDERMRIEDDAVADHRKLAGTHHPGGQQRELVHGSPDDERMTGIVAALKAHDHVRLLGEPIDDLAFALVAPLGAHDDRVRHRRPPMKNPGARPGSGLETLLAVMVDRDDEVKVPNCDAQNGKNVVTPRSRSLRCFLQRRVRAPFAQAVRASGLPAR